MSFSSFFSYVCATLSNVPWEHCILICLLSIILSTLFVLRGKYSVWNTSILCIIFIIGFLLLDLAVLLRYGNKPSHYSGLDFSAEIDRLSHGGIPRRIEIICNICAFIPFGFFLSVFLSTSKRLRIWGHIGYVSIVCFVLSLCIECLQLVMRVGFFEVTDLVMNTVGAFFGAGISVLIRAVITKTCKHANL